MSITFFPDLPFHTKPMLNKLYLQLCHLKYVAWMIWSVCSQPRRYCRWRGYLAACCLRCSNYRWHHDIVKLFYLFFIEWMDYVCHFRNYVAFSTVSLILWQGNWVSWNQDFRPDTFRFPTCNMPTSSWAMLPKWSKLRSVSYNKPNVISSTKRTLVVGKVSTNVSSRWESTRSQEIPHRYVNEIWIWTRWHTILCLFRMTS